MKQLNPEAMFETIRDEVFTFIKELGGKNNSTYRKHMEGAIVPVSQAVNAGEGLWI